MDEMADGDDGHAPVTEVDLLRRGPIAQPGESALKARAPSDQPVPHT
jgi:hypothetical protein